MRNKRTGSSGFTVVELMVSVAVAAILMGFAIPAFTDFLRQRTMASRINDFVMAVTYARSEAVRRGSNVSIQARGGESDNEWGLGYDVVDVTSGAVLRSFDPMDDATLNALGAGWNDEYTLTFNGRGLLTPQPAGPGAIQLCHVDAGVNPGRVVNMGVIGRADVEEFACP